jgi:hypothetical protein
MYYWDGQTWKSTLSPDGRFRWDGTAWTPVSSMAASPYWTGPPQREPTSWTRPLQYAVAGWYVWSILYTLAEPLWMGGMMSNVINQTFQRQQQLNPDVSPPPAALTDMISNMMSVGLWVSAVLYSAVFVVAVVAAWRRWTWAYYAILVLLGLTALLLPIQLVYVFMGPAVGAVAGVAMPAWVYALNFFTGLPAIALFAWMLVALIKRGPWAMRRPSAY